MFTMLCMYVSRVILYIIPISVIIIIVRRGKELGISACKYKESVLLPSCWLVFLSTSMNDTLIIFICL
jgi:hypothetical protein